MGSIDIVTRQDLVLFKEELLKEMHLLFEKAAPPKTRRWLKTYEVKAMLGISAGTLQTMRNNGDIPYSLIGGLAFYEYDDILKMMDKHKQRR